MTPVELGERLAFTLTEAFYLACKCEVFATIDPLEFATMTPAERRRCRCKLKRIARNAASSPITPEEEAAMEKYEPHGERRMIEATNAWMAG